MSRNIQPITQKQYRTVINKTAVHPEGKAIFLSQDATNKDIEKLDGEDLKKVLQGKKSTEGLPLETLDVGKVYALLGLLGEAGEMANKQKKVIRGDQNPPQPDDELNDVRWYVENLARLYNRLPGQLEAENADKLLDRKERGVLKGSGDKR